MMYPKPYSIYLGGTIGSTPYYPTRLPNWDYGKLGHNSGFRVQGGHSSHRGNIGLYWGYNGESNGKENGQLHGNWNYRVACRGFIGHTSVPL